MRVSKQPGFLRQSYTRTNLVPAVLGIGMGLLLLSTSTGFAADQKQAEMVSDLKTGGYVVYIRHASTEKDYADQVTADVNNCATQRTLSEGGWDEAEKIGAAFSMLNIPVGALYSSEYCRAWATARIAFGKPVKKAGLNFEPAEEYTSEQIETMSGYVTPMLSTIPAEGTNTVIVGHDDPFESATGIYPEPQGVAYVVKPNGSGFNVVGFIKPEDWNGLLAAQ